MISVFIGMLVSYNKLPQIWCFKTTEICSLTLLEANSLKSVQVGRDGGAGSDLLPPEARGEAPSLSLPAPGVASVLPSVATSLQS